MSEPFVVSVKKNPTGEMSFWDHLDELRGVLIRSVVALLLSFSVLFFFKDFLFGIVVLGPTESTFPLYRLLGITVPQLHLINIEISAQFFIHIKVTFFAALTLSFPFLCYQLWTFVAPALYRNERKSVKKAFGLGALLFYLGLAVGYFIVMPVVLVFFHGYQVSPDVTNSFSLSSYISMFTSMVFLMGILFEFPSVLAVLSHFGIIDRQMMRGFRRYAIVVILVLAAVLTPTGDPFTMMVVAAPLYLLYEFSIMICRKDSSELS